MHYTMLFQIHSFNGRVIGTDAARELSKEYAGWEGVLMNSAVTSTPASAYAHAFCNTSGAI